MTKEKQKIETIAQALHHIQLNLHAPKNQFNKFGNYKYRSCEDILEGLKKIMPENCYVTIQDEIVLVGDRVYVKAIASLCYGDNCISNTAFAREPESRKGMDESQITGATSSYARKYALNGLFLIDDVKDADAQDKPEEKTEKKPAPKKKTYEQEQAEKLSKQLKEATTPELVEYVWNGFANDLEKIRLASPDRAYPALEKLYADRLAATSEAPIDEDNIPY